MPIKIPTHCDCGAELVLHCGSYTLPVAPLPERALRVGRLGRREQPTTPPQRTRRADPRVTDPYRCAVCGRATVVPSLARQCEQRHDSSSTESETRDG